jgi:hypothetical protein
VGLSVNIAIETTRNNKKAGKLSKIQGGNE